MAGISRQSDSIGDVVQRNLASGALVGAGAYVVGYVLTFVLTVVDGVESGSVDSWKAVGWVFYGGHNVDIQQSISSDQGSASRTVDIFGQGVSELGSTVPQVVYLLVPVVALLGAGYVAYGRADGGRLETTAVAAVGATVAVGYLVLAVLGAFLFEESGGAFGVDASIAPELGTAVVLAGIVYPVVLGAVGAVVANAQDSGRSGGRLG